MNRSCAKLQDLPDYRVPNINALWAEKISQSIAPFIDLAFHSVIVLTNINLE